MAIVRSIRAAAYFPRMSGEPDAANPHAGFAARGAEMEQGWILWHRQPKGPANTHGEIAVV